LILEVPVDLENLERQWSLALPSPPDFQSHLASQSGLADLEFLESLAPLVGLACPEGLLQ
jgi:hypothetical protein